MRATMELYGDAIEYPPIHTQIALGTEDLTVKVKLLCCLNLNCKNLFLSVRFKCFQNKLFLR